MDKKFRIFTICSFLYCLLLALVCHPVVMESQGDAPAYIELAKQFLGMSDSPTDLSSRQPMYSIFLAPIIRFWGENRFSYPVMYCQFFMVFLSSLLLYKLFEKFRLFKSFPLITAILYLLNISTINYASSVLSETLSLLIFTIIVYVLIENSEKDRISLWFVLGLLAGLMVLARFNMLGLPVFIVLCMLLIHYRHYGIAGLKKSIYPFLSCSLGLFLVLNIWSLYNLSENGFYGVFPSYHAGQRWAIPATIKRTNNVSGKYKPLLEIFVKARQEYEEENPGVNLKKGSLLENQTAQRLYLSMKPQVNGYQVYKLAHDDLLKYFDLEDNSGDNARLGYLLRPFYKEIAKQNRAELTKFRFYSLINTFRAGGTTLPVNEKININVLPAFLIIIYKILFFCMALFTYVVALCYFVFKIKSMREDKNWKFFILIILVSYFPVVHFYANVISDANRFKFPAEPLIIGLFIYFVYTGLGYFKKKIQPIKF